MAHKQHREVLGQVQKPTKRRRCAAKLRTQARIARRDKGLFLLPGLRDYGQTRAEVAQQIQA